MNKRDATKLAAEVVRPLALEVPADRWDDLVKSIIDVFMDNYDSQTEIMALRKELKDFANSTRATLSARH